MKARTCPSGKLLNLWKYKTIETVHQGQITKVVWQLGRYEPSPPSTKELHDCAVTLLLRLQRQVSLNIGYFSLANASPLWGKLYRRERSTKTAIESLPTFPGSPSLKIFVSKSGDCKLHIIVIVKLVLVRLGRNLPVTLYTKSIEGKNKINQTWQQGLDKILLWRTVQASGSPSVWPEKNR